MKNKYPGTFALLLSVCAQAVFAQSPDSGFYVGLGAGQSNYSIDLDKQINAAYLGNADYHVNRVQVIDDSDGAYKVFAGYRFSPWFALEAGASDSGHATAFYELENTAPGTFSGHVDVQSRYRLRGLDAVALGELPLGQRFGASLRAGFVASRLNYREDGTYSQPGNHSYQFVAPTKNQVKPLAGLGLAWHFIPRWDLRLDWDRSFDEGKKFDLSNGENGRFDHVDQYSLDVIYRMGGK
jgi:hypothetical protein